MYEYDCPHNINQLHVEEDEWCDLVWCDCGAMIGEMKKDNTLWNWYYDEDNEESPLWI
jgi:hypothetical protein